VIHSPVPDTRNTGHHMGLNDLSVFKQLGVVTRGEANDAIHVDDQELKEALIADGQTGARECDSHMRKR
jgi:hypothetical protein